MKRSLKRIIGLGLILGIGLLLIQEFFNIDSDLFMSYYWKIGVLIVLLVVLVNGGYYLVYINRMKKIMPLLEEGKYEAYIGKMEGLLEKAKGRPLRTIIKLNLSAGYTDNNKNQKSLELLESIRPEDLKGREARLVYGINLCLSYIRLGDSARAEEVYRKNQDLFDQYQDHDQYGGHIGELRILRAIDKGDYEGARKLVEEAKARWKDPRLIEDFMDLEKIILENTQA